jgi:hypothetical protein
MLLDGGPKKTFFDKTSCNDAEAKGNPSALTKEMVDISLEQVATQLL